MLVIDTEPRLERKAGAGEEQVAVGRAAVQGGGIVVIFVCVTTDCFSSHCWS